MSDVSPGERTSILQAVARLETRLDTIDKDIDHLDSRQQDMLAQMNRWKGAVPVLLAIGGLAAWLLTNVDKLRGFFR